MSDLKMSDVFAFFSIENHYHVLYSAESINDTAEYNSNNDLAVFNCTEHAEYAAHAINSHDRLVQEIAQLKSDKAELLAMLKRQMTGNINLVELKLLPSKCYERDATRLADDTFALLQKHKG